MILMWAGMLGLLFALFFVGNQETTWTLLERLTAWLASLPFVGPRFVEWMEARAQDGAIDMDFGRINFESAVLTAWGFISAIFMGLAFIAGHFFGPFKPWTLKRKLGVAALACLLVVIAFLALYLLDQELWNDPFSKALFTASGLAILLFIVSAWCLTVSHALGWLSGVVAGIDFERNPK